MSTHPDPSDPEMTSNASSDGEEEDEYENTPPPQFTQFIADVGRPDYVAPPEYVQAVNNSIQATERAIDRLEEEMRLLHSRHLEIEAKKQTMQELLLHFRSSLSPIRALPSSILLEIFMYLLPVSPDTPLEIDWDTPFSTSMDKRYAPWLTGSVCKRWKFVTMSSPQLWKTVALRISCRSSPGHGSCFALYARRLNYFLSQSQPYRATLRVFIHLGKVDPDCRSFPLIMLNLAPHAHRITTLNIRYQVNSLDPPMQPMNDLMQGLVGTTPGIVQSSNFSNLVAFSCGVTLVDSVKDSVVVRYTGEERNGFDMTRLQTSSPTRFHYATFVQTIPSLSPGAFPWSQMKTLVLQRLSAAVVLELLPHVTHLRRLELVEIRPPPLDDEQIPNISPEDLAALRLPESLEDEDPITFPNLEIFTMHPPASCILDNINTPSLRRFHTNDDSSTHKHTHSTVIDSIIWFFQRNSATLNFLIVDVALPDYRLRDFFYPLANLVTLEYGFNDGCGFDETCVYPDDIMLLINDYSTEFETTAPPMPKLEVLHLRFTGPLEEHPPINFKVLCDILKGRAETGRTATIRSATFTEVEPDCTAYDDTPEMVQQRLDELKRAGVNVLFETVNEDLLNGQSDDESDDGGTNGESG